MNCKCGNNEFIQKYEFGRVCTICGMNYYFDNGWHKIHSTFKIAKIGIEDEIEYSTSEKYAMICSKCHKSYSTSVCLNCKYKDTVGSIKRKVEAWEK